MCGLALAGGAVAATRPAITYDTTNGRVWITNAQGKDAHNLGIGYAPLLAPNGRTVVANSLLTVGIGHPIVLYTTRGHVRPEYYFDSQKQDGIPVAWSPDSRYVAFALKGVGTGGGTYQGYGLGIVDTRTGQTKMIASRVVIMGASFAPGSSDKIVYASASSLLPNAPVNVFTSTATGADTKAITHDGRSLRPVWGAGGIAFDHEHLRGASDPSYQIWTMRANGSHRQQLTHTTITGRSSGLTPVAFSLDGTRLLASDANGAAHAITVAGDREKSLTIAGRPVLAAAISRTGQSVLVETGKQGPPSRNVVETMPFFGGHPTALIAHGGDASWNLWATRSIPATQAGPFRPPRELNAPPAERPTSRQALANLFCIDRHGAARGDALGHDLLARMVDDISAADIVLLMDQRSATLWSGTWALVAAVSAAVAVLGVTPLLLANTSVVEVIRSDGGETW
jgi:hypothetical protein